MINIEITGVSAYILLGIILVLLCLLCLFSIWIIMAIGKLFTLLIDFIIKKRTKREFKNVETILSSIAFYGLGILGVEGYIMIKENLLSIGQVALILSILMFIGINYLLFDGDSK